MHVSQKCQYALRAVFELSRREGSGPVRIAEIAGVQVIPVRFLEQILNQLRQGGFVESRRGNGGGYLLARSPEEMTVGEIIRFVEGPLDPVQCVTNDSTCPLKGNCVFLPMWEKAQKAVAEVYDTTTFKGLMDMQMQLVGASSLNYTI